MFIPGQPASAKDESRRPGVDGEQIEPNRLGVAVRRSWIGLDSRHSAGSSPFSPMSQPFLILLTDAEQSSCPLSMGCSQITTAA